MPSKSLGKALLKISAMGLERTQLERILLTSANQMPQALDDVNISTFLSIMVKLNIQSTQCLERIVPFCYKIADLPRAIACCLMMSKFDISKQLSTVKAFAIHVAQRLPIEGRSVSFRDLGRLCEALSFLDLYCHEVGHILMPIIREELETFNHEGNALYVTSVLIYLGRMNLGDLSLWRLYSHYITQAAMNHHPYLLLKSLETFSARNVRCNELLSKAGDILSEAVDSLHPSQVSRIADIYSSSKFQHQKLMEALVMSSERIIASMDSRGSVKLLKCFILFHGAKNPGGIRISNGQILHKLDLALYMILNKCSTSIK